MGKRISNVSQAVADGIVRGWDVMALHEFFSEAFTGFQPRRGLGGAEDPISAPRKFVYDAQLQRQLRTDDRKVRLDPRRQREQRLDILHVSGQALSLGRSPSIAGAQ